MKYVAFRIDTRSILDGKVIDGFFVRGQRDTDYNWPLISSFPDMEAAKTFIRSFRSDPEQQPVYGPDGYGIKI